jgi:hypothetical protein
MMLMAGCYAYSPFMATQYYVLRGIRNIQLKVKEYQHSQYCKKLEEQASYLPAATHVSHLHYMDEAFHTATSQVICHELYKDLKKPTAFEVFMANKGTSRVQTTLSTLSGAVPGIFSQDGPYMPLVHRMLQTRIFGLSATEALQMVEKCFCREHDGFHAAAKYHQRALTDARSYIADLEYITPANRELRSMAKASIAKSLKENRAAFQKFCRTAELARR